MCTFTNFDFGLSELRFVTRNDNITHHRQFTSTTQSETVHSCDNWLLYLCDLHITKYKTRESKINEFFSYLLSHVQTQDTQHTTHKKVTSQSCGKYLFPSTEHLIVVHIHVRFRSHFFDISTCCKSFLTSYTIGDKQCIISLNGETFRLNSSSSHKGMKICFVNIDLLLQCNQFEDLHQTLARQDLIRASEHR